MRQSHIESATEISVYGWISRTRSHIITIYNLLYRTMRGIPLAFRPPTVRFPEYCAAEVMTNYTQFCIEQLH